jgi:hypothetical protein
MSVFASQRFAWVVVAGALSFAAWTCSRAWRESSATSASTAAGPPSYAEARQQDILKANAGRPGDPDLMRQFATFNAQYFGGALSRVAVRWEPELAEVGSLSGEGFTLQGMFGRVGSDGLILLNPVVRADPRALERALSHEMAHAYLDAMGDTTTGHGPAFQAVLKRLAVEGAFEGVAADATEKMALKAWLDEESARIDAERREMNALDVEIKQMAGELEREIAAFNARAERLPAEAEALEARRQQFNQRVLETNERLQRDWDDLAQFNREVARYNLMMAYPDGLDEQSLVSSKPALARASGR